VQNKTFLEENHSAPIVFKEQLLGKYYRLRMKKECQTMVKQIKNSVGLLTSWEQKHPS